ncbi:hypothetical protein [Microbacterium sp. ZXX196]|uniref:hypothetical protein n=1 Tax=Microbacterium sp. ZXX196 TaxID=2609291 RepID=UPI0012BA2DD6|nr:hypothetical protein [Microbacterium sp. ZXX196]MTE22998.1 hypothetical protein [Microbacterium sp. ZXX196]
MAKRRGLVLAAGAVALLGGVGALGALAVWGLVALVAPAPVEVRPAGGTGAERPAFARPAEAGDEAWVADAARATGIPERALAAYADADRWARRELGCAVGWNTLAGIGWVESHHGTLQGGAVDADGVARPHIRGIPLDGTNETLAIPDTDGGALDGDAEWDRAVGPLQFIPETWRIWASAGADPHNIDDAARTAARYLCRLDGTLDTEEAWIRAVRSYNDTLDYQQRVAAAASRYADAA